MALIVMEMTRIKHPPTTKLNPGKRQNHQVPDTKYLPVFLNNWLLNWLLCCITRKLI